MGEREERCRLQGAGSSTGWGGPGRRGGGDTGDPGVGGAWAHRFPPHPPPDLLRARQEVAAAAAARNPGAMEAHIPTGGNSSSQRRKQGLPQHRDSHFPDR